MIYRIISENEEQCKKLMDLLYEKGYKYSSATRYYAMDTFQVRIIDLSDGNIRLSTNLLLSLQITIRQSNSLVMFTHKVLQNPDIIPKYRRTTWDDIWEN